MKRRSIKFILCLFLGLLLSVGHFTVFLSPTLAVNGEAEGKILYRNRQYREAIERWRAVLGQYGKDNDLLGQARVLNDLSLAYRRIGAWTEAEKAIDDSFALLDRVPRNPESVAILARTWNNRGALQLARGQAREAFDSWRTAEGFYRSIKDDTGVFRSRVNQAIALKTLGFYPRAERILAAALRLPDGRERENLLRTLPPSLNTDTLTAWRVFGEILEASGKPEIAVMIFQNLLSRVENPEQRGEIALSLANAALESGDSVTAMERFEEVSAGAIWQSQRSKHSVTAPEPLVRLRADLALLEIYADREEIPRAIELLPAITESIEKLPLDRDRVAAEINFAVRLLKLREMSTDTKIPDRTAIARRLAKARETARQIGAIRLESLALGELAGLYESDRQYSIARQLTREALTLSLNEIAPELSYRWQWQLGRILAAEGERGKAIASYSDAIATLRSIEPDIVAADRGSRFSFRDEVEPVYRQFVSLLLQPDENGQIPSETLEKARETIESFRVAELNNFFREACLESQPRALETIDPDAAILYPIVLPDRLAILLALPNRPLQYFSSPVPRKELENVVRDFRFHIVVRPKRDFFAPGEQLYRWLIRPIEAELQAADVKTLVFVLDGVLRNVPMGALYDGREFLIQKYRIALNPSSRLLDPQRLQKRGLSTLAAGLTSAREGFPPLYYVGNELKTIRNTVNSDILLNEGFTIAALENRLLSDPTPIVHIATHGQFSSKLENTFILAWDGPIDVGELDRLLKGREEGGEMPVELLVLSACETATGDERAALGLAGFAVRSGARSTIATLWPVNDEATSEFMKAFYSALVEKKFSKADALREAQLTLLRQDKFRHPFYWSPYVLLGNWL